MGGEELRLGKVLVVLHHTCSLNIGWYLNLPSLAYDDGTNTCVCVCVCVWIVLKTMDIQHWAVNKLCESWNLLLYLLYMCNSELLITHLAHHSGYGKIHSISPHSWAPISRRVCIPWWWYHCYAFIDHKYIMCQFDDQLLPIKYLYTTCSFCIAILWRCVLNATWSNNICTAMSRIHCHFERYQFYKDQSLIYKWSANYYEVIVIRVENWYPISTGEFAQQHQRQPRVKQPNATTWAYPTISF